MKEIPLPEAYLHNILTILETMNATLEAIRNAIEKESGMTSETPGRAAPYDPEVSDVSLSEATAEGYGVVILTVDNCSTMITRAHLSGMYSWIGEWLARHPLERTK